MTRHVRAHWTNAILVCGKCSKKLGGGFGKGGKLPLAKALRKHLGIAKGRKAVTGIVEVKCLGICPKRAVCVIDTANPGAWKLVPDGSDVVDVARDLGLSGRAAD
ncbi:(2Fe-2S) ferredoxin domain-containing protein [Sphingomonas japonica]|uniref:Metal-binding protein n=1 Tax=Sphingomonas japonica TaxID=511662 RepID=A0ABX0U7I8_9SPHN|nr:(2Fe-2S) ferredoxin domain-containing protein [Sphingomonas japonica]NIJ24738.1 putative metal-binding protein [Sphingomonas japonica]